MVEPFQSDDPPPGADTASAAGVDRRRGAEGPRAEAAPDEAVEAPSDVAGAGDAAEPPLRQLDPRWVVAERMSGAIGAAVVSLGGLAAVIVFGGGWRALGLGAWLVLSIVLFAGAMTAPALQYRRGRYRVTPFGIEIRWGVLWRRVTIVPRSRIQHTDVEQGPLLRRFGLAKLVIHTAGTEHSTVPLHGLALADATAIRDDLIGRGGFDGAGGGDGDGV